MTHTAHYPYEPPDRCIYCQEEEIVRLEARVAELEHELNRAWDAIISMDDACSQGGKPVYHDHQRHWVLKNYIMIHRKAREREAD